MSRHDEVSKTVRNVHDTVTGLEGRTEVMQGEPLSVSKDGNGFYRSETTEVSLTALDAGAIFVPGAERSSVDGSEAKRVVVAQAKPTQSASDAAEANTDREAADQNAPGTPGLPATGPSLPASGLRSSGSAITPLAPIGDETARWGRDDLKHHEMGSQGESLRPLVGLPVRPPLASGAGGWLPAGAAPGLSASRWPDRPAWGRMAGS